MLEFSKYCCCVFFVFLTTELFHSANLEKKIQYAIFKRSFFLIIFKHFSVHKRIFFYFYTVCFFQSVISLH